MIVFDSRHDVGEGQETTLEYSIKLAASVAGYVIQRGGKIQVATGAMPRHEIEWTPLLKELALLEAGPGPNLEQLIDSLPAGVRVLAFVSEHDSNGIDSLRLRAAQMSGLAVVSLEGFGDGSSESGTVDMDALASAGVPVVACRRGELRESLQELERMAWSTGPEMQKPVGGRRP